MASKKKYNMKAYGVIGQYGMTMASRLEHMAQREARRLKKLGFSPNKPDDQYIHYYSEGNK